MHVVTGNGLTASGHFFHTQTIRMLKESPSALPVEPSAGRAVPEPLVDRFMELMPRLKRLFESGLPDDLRDQLNTVTPHQIQALCHLASQGGATMHELARAQGCATSSVTSLADRLLRHGLAERVSDLADRRVVRLVPTPAAAALVERFTAARRETARLALGSLGADEARTLVDLLGRVAAGGGDD